MPAVYAPNGVVCNMLISHSEASLSSVINWVINTSDEYTSSEVDDIVIDTPTQTATLALILDTGEGSEITRVQEPSSPSRQVSYWIGSIHGTQVNVPANGTAYYTPFLRLQQTYSRTHFHRQRSN